MYDVKADGNCLFRAVSLGLYGTQEKHDRIRANVVKFLREYWHGMIVAGNGADVIPALLLESWRLMLHHENGEYPTQMESELFEDELACDLQGKVNWYCDQLAKDKQWGNDECIMAIASVYDVSVVVFDVESKMIVRQQKPGRPELYVRFVDTNHYQFMEPSKICLEMPVSE